MSVLTRNGALQVGQWVAMVGDEIVATGDTEEEALERAESAGYPNVTTACVAEPGTYVL